MGTKQSWQIFKDTFLSVQVLSILQLKKSSRGGRKPARLSKDLLGILRAKKGAYKLSKQGHVSWEEYRDAIKTCRCGIRKAKAQEN